MRKRYVPTRPCSGELALASARMGSRPARRALRPASQASAMALAMAGGSPARAIALLISRASVSYTHLTLPTKA